MQNPSGEQGVYNSYSLEYRGWYTITGAQYSPARNRNYLLFII